MRRTTVRGSSLALAALLCGFAQEGPSDEDVRATLKDLAAGEAAAARALEVLDRLPVSRLEDLHRMAAAETREVRAAARALLPPASWIYSTESTVGDVRAKLRQYVADLASTEPDKQEVRFEAVRQLIVRGNAAAGADVLKVYRELQPAESSYLCRVLAVLGNGDYTPVLAEILLSGGPSARYAIDALAEIGDARAVNALLKRMESGPDDLYRCLEVLPSLGGEAALEELRKRIEDPAAPAWLWSRVTQGRLKLRDPRLPADLLKGGGPERHLERLIFRGLARMGDRSVVPALVQRVEDPKSSREDRFTAMQAIAVLGNREHAPLAVRYLEDPVVAGAAADALAAFGDASSAEPLARALKKASSGGPFARALMAVPLEGVEAHLLEILGDPKGHPLTLKVALPVAGRAGGARLREKLIDLMMAPGAHLYDGFEVAAALVPLLDPKDLRRLSRSSSPELPEEHRTAEYPRLAARAALGDREARRAFVQGCAGGGFDLWMDDRSNPLNKYPGKPADLADEVRTALEERPHWSHGAEFLFLLNPSAGWEVVENAGGGPAPSMLVRGLAAIRRGDPLEAGMESALELLGDAVLVEIARALPDEAVRRLRAEIVKESLVWKHESETFEAKNGGARITRRLFYNLTQVGDIRLGLLAARADPVLESLYRARLREPSYQQGKKFADRMSALALARLGADDQFDAFVRLLRSDPVQDRSLGARCLSLLGDPKAIRHLAPLLDDRERLVAAGTHAAPYLALPPLPPMLCEHAADAVEQLSGEKFPAKGPERLTAIKAWCAK